MIFADDIYSSSVALTATAASTNYKDFGGDFDKGPGVTRGVVIVVEVAADYASANETYKFDFETDDNTSFSSATVLATTGTLNGNTLTAGTKLFLPLGNTNERYTRVNVTLAGTTPAITYSAYFGFADEVISGGVIYDSGLQF